MRYLGGAPLELPLPVDPGIILILFFSSVSATAFIILSWSMAAPTNSLYDRLANYTRRSCRWMVIPAWYRLAFLSSMSIWYDPYWARVLNCLMSSNTMWFPYSRSKNSFSLVRSRPIDRWCARKAVWNSPHGTWDQQVGRMLEAHQAPSEPLRCCIAYRVFWYFVHWSSTNLDSMVWSQLSTSKGSVASVKTGGWVAKKSEYDESLSWCRGCWRSAPRRSSFSTSLLIRSFWVASSCSRLTGGRGGGGGGVFPCETWPHPRPADPSGMSRFSSSDVLVLTICHIDLSIIRYLHMSSRIWCKLCIR
jgi:hypothetical protein